MAIAGNQEYTYPGTVCSGDPGKCSNGGGEYSADLVVTDHNEPTLTTP